VGEQDFVDYLGSNGWNVEWISVLEEDSSHGPPDQSDATYWASTYDLDPASVLFDASQSWASDAVASGYPTVYTVHTSNMLIWDRTDGWVSPTGPDWAEFLAWWPDFLDYCAAQPNAID
jgi:hypothetical protein